MQYDLVVIGSGPGGYRAAVLAAQQGLRVGIVEKADWGGCGLNRGCTPKNAWHHSAKLIAASRSFAKRGVQGSLSGDLAQAWEHQKKIVKAVRDSYMTNMKRLGIGGFAGQAAFIDPHTLALDGRDQIQTQHVIIATGAAPFVPKPFYQTEGKVLTSDDLFNQAPPAGKRVALIGSGAVATEFAFILTMLGKEVVWLSSNPPLSNSRFSAEAQKLLQEKLQSHGITPRTHCRPEAVEILPDGVKLLCQGGDEEIIVDWVLLGTGRRPHTTGLNLDAANVNTDSKGFIKVNEYLQTTQTNIYAIGDVANPRMTANHALADAQCAVANILNPASQQQQRQAIPDLIYSALELGRVGIKGNGETAAIGLATYEWNPCALGQDDPDGFVRLLANPENGQLESAEIVGTDAGELIQLIAQRYGESKLLATLMQAHFNHPTRAEAVLNAAELLNAQLQAAPVEPVAASS